MSQRITIIISVFIAALIFGGLFFWWFFYQLPTVLAPVGEESSALVNRAQKANNDFTSVIDRVKDFLPSSTPPVVPPPQPTPQTTTTVSSTNEILVP